MEELALQRKDSRRGKKLHARWKQRVCRIVPQWVVLPDLLNCLIVHFTLETCLNIFFIKAIIYVLFFWQNWVLYRFNFVCPEFLRIFLPGFWKLTVRNLWLLMLWPLIWMTAYNPNGKGEWTSAFLMIYFGNWGVKALRSLYHHCILYFYYVCWRY